MSFVNAVLTLLHVLSTHLSVSSTLTFSLIDTRELADICVDKFGSEFRNATKSWRPLPESQRTKVLRNALGMGAKLIYAFLWQVGRVWGWLPGFPRNPQIFPGIFQVAKLNGNSWEFLP